MKILFFLLLALFLVTPQVVNAQGAASAPAAPSADGMRIMPVPPDSRPQNLFGQNHYYTVTFRGNGEAVVTFKAILSNTGTSPLSTVSLHLPENVMPSEIMAYQVIQEPQCIRYLPVVQPNPSVPYKEQCAEYQEPNYQYLYGNTRYQRIDNQTQNNTVLLQLPTPIEPNKNGSYFVYYRTNAITSKDLFGAYNYKFTTLKTEDKIHTLQVGISTDAENILRGAKADVNYASQGTTMAALPAADSAERGVSSPQFDQFYNQIGSGIITKQASDLASMETYAVEGMFADSQTKLYGKEIATTIAVILLLVILAIIITRVTLNRVARKKADKPEEAVAQLKVQNKTFLVALSISFISMLLVSLYTFGVYAIMQLLTPGMYYSYPNDNMILTLFVFAVSALVYLFFFFAPAVGMGIKRGLGWGLVTFSATVVWAVLFLLLLFAVLFFFNPKQNGYPRPYPLMNVMEGRTAPAGAVDLAPPMPADVVKPAVEPQTLMKSEPAQPGVADTTVEPKAAESGPLPVRSNQVETTVEGNTR